MSDDIDVPAQPGDDTSVSGYDGALDRSSFDGRRILHLPREPWSYLRSPRSSLNKVVSWMNAHWQFRVIILDSDFHDVRDHTRTPRSRPVIIGDRVWLGNRVTILPGVSIGDDSVIGAGTVVVKSVPSRSVAVGNPARVVKAL